MSNHHNSISRQRTPWDEQERRTPSENFIRDVFKADYARKHRRLIETDEAALINSYDSNQCPICGSANTKKCGFTADGIQNHLCKNCHHHFTPLTGTIHQDHKIPVTEWIEYWRNLLQYLSLNADSWNNKNSFTTAKYWFKKTCLLLENYQDSIVLKGKVWYDATEVPVVKGDIIRRADGKKLRGNSVNQINIGTATDGTHTYLAILGNGHPKQSVVYEAFKDHIEHGSQLITDEDRDHRLLVKKLGLNNVEYNSKELKKLTDKENPMNEVNQIHNYLQSFLRAHNSFKRSELPDYINLFALMINPPMDKLEKINILLNLSFRTPKTLKYRDLFRIAKPELDDQ